VAALVVAALAGACPGVAGAAGETRPSAENLWTAYPLDQPTPSATPERGRTVAAPATPAADRTPAGSAGGFPVALLIVAALGVLAGTALSVQRRSGREPEAVPVMTPATTRRRTPSSAPLRAIERPAGAPPEPAVAWEAEVTWEAAGGTGRFRALGVAIDGDAYLPVEVGRSRALRWPPSGPADIADLTRASEELEAALLTAGWSARPAGDEWYAKRFAWTPERERETEMATRGTVQTSRFQRAEPWPADTEPLWRCEIRWRAGWISSRFEAVAAPPGERRGRPIGTTDPLKWTLKADPDPDGAETRAALAQLVADLLGAGWEREGRGRHWYAQRFSWRREGDPPLTGPPERAEVRA
jgi:hypothetical protein